MVEDSKLLSWIIGEECGEGSVRGLHFRKLISLFADGLYEVASKEKTKG